MRFIQRTKSARPMWPEIKNYLRLIWLRILQKDKSTGYVNGTQFRVVVNRTSGHLLESFNWCKNIKTCWVRQLTIILRHLIFLEANSKLNFGPNFLWSSKNTSPYMTKGNWFFRSERSFQNRMAGNTSFIVCNSVKSLTKTVDDGKTICTIIDCSRIIQESWRVLAGKSVTKLYRSCYKKKRLERNFGISHKSILNHCNPKPFFLCLEHPVLP